MDGVVSTNLVVGHALILTRVLIIEEWVWNHVLKRCEIWLRIVLLGHHPGVLLINWIWIFAASILLFFVASVSLAFALGGLVHVLRLVLQIWIRVIRILFSALGQLLVRMKNVFAVASRLLHGRLGERSHTLGSGRVLGRDALDRVLWVLVAWRVLVKTLLVLVVFHL